MLPGAFEMAIAGLREQLVAERRRVDELVHQLADAREKGLETDPLPAIAIQTLSQAVEMLREDVGHERDRADQAERRIEVERTLVEDGRKRVDELQSALTDAIAAERIAAANVNASHAQADARGDWRLLRRLRWAIRKT
jgi:hypothetical protein